ncbi:MAG TPA: sorbosone dehydrogenase family protein [Devosia sp.]|nr:sorbosone dehydrogenase family protein [Devosia sp.]
MRPLSLIVSLPLLVAAGASPAAPVLTGKAAFGDWTKDAPGVVRHLTLDDLPPPYASKSAANNAQPRKRPDNLVPKVPDGFKVDLVASGIRNPRAMRVAPDGDLFVADSEANEVLVFHFGAAGAKPTESVFASGLHQPYGINFYPADNPKWVYVANSNSVVRFPYGSGDLKAAGKPETIVPSIPSNHHWTRDIVFSPDGKTMYLSVGSGSNVAEDMSKTPPGGVAAWAKDHPLGEAWGSEERRAAIWSMTPEGKDVKIYATGLRNCAGMTVQPETGNVWCAVNERDELGDNVPFEYATHVEQGAWYGWPWYYLGNHEDPRHKGERPDLAGKATVPDVLMQAHSAPLNIVFYEGDQFGPDYKGDAFVALHGSWNRGSRTGYKVVLLPFKNGKPTGDYEDFMTGMVLGANDVWGRPVGLAVGKDGSLFVSEDGNGTIWRISKQ